MRGVVVVIMTIFVVMLALFVSVATIEPLGEHVKGYDSIDEGALEGTSVVNSVYDGVFKWLPLITIGGMFVWGLRWYIRKERRRGRVR